MLTNPAVYNIINKPFQGAHKWRHSSEARATGSYPVGRGFKSNCRYQIRPGGQAVKTPPFHGGNTSSILVRVTKHLISELIYEDGLVWVSFFLINKWIAKKTAVTLICYYRLFMYGYEILIFKIFYPHTQPQSDYFFPFIRWNVIISAEVIQ